MPSVRVKENEPFEVALRRFKRTCEKAGVLSDVRKREFFEKPSQERKRKKAAVSADAARPEKLQQSVLSDGRLFIHGRHDWQVYGESGPGVPLGPARDGAAAALDDHSAKRQAKPRADAGSLS